MDGAFAAGPGLGMVTDGYRADRFGVTGALICPGRSNAGELRRLRWQGWLRRRGAASEDRGLVTF
jgi:hypothetical protein